MSMGRITLTKGLWVGNALALLAVVLVLYSQLSGLLFGSAKGRPELRPIQPQPLPVMERPPLNGNKNPFDSNAGHWKTADSKRGGDGELRGILLLPGVQVAVTGSGIVRAGESMNGGKIAGIKQDRLIIQQENQNQEIKLPSAQRPTLQTLNKAQTPSKEKSEP